MKILMEHLNAPRVPQFRNLKNAQARPVSFYTFMKGMLPSEIQTTAPRPQEDSHVIPADAVMRFLPGMI